MLKNRSVAMVIILSIVTCGIYSLYWAYVTVTALDEEGNASNMPAIVQFILFFLYVGYIVFAINANNNLNAIRAKKGLPEKDQMVIYLLLGIFIPIVLVALVQNEINELA